MNIKEKVGRWTIRAIKLVNGVISLFIWGCLFLNYLQRVIRMWQCYGSGYFSVQGHIACLTTDMTRSSAL